MILVKNSQDVIKELQLQIKAKDKWIGQLLKQIEELAKISDICQKCGCSEFLCGHNKRD